MSFCSSLPCLLPHDPPRDHVTPPPRAFDSGHAGAPERRRQENGSAVFKSCVHVSLDGDRDPLHPQVCLFSSTPRVCRSVAPRGSSDLQGWSSESKPELKLSQPTV